MNAFNIHQKDDIPSVDYHWIKLFQCILMRRYSLFKKILDLLLTTYTYRYFETFGTFFYLHFTQIFTNTLCHTNFHSLDYIMEKTVVNICEGEYYNDFVVDWSSME